MSAFKKKKKKFEFSKVLVVWAMSITTICIALSYILAALGLDSCSEVTYAVVTTLTAIAVAYEAKSYGEKNSRNKYGVDINMHDGFSPLGGAGMHHSIDDFDFEEETDDTPALG